MGNILAKSVPIKRKIILGTDWHTDCDDAVAIRILAWAHIHRVVDLLGVSIDSATEHSVSSLRAFLQCEGIGEVPVAIDHNAYDYEGSARYQPRLAAMETNQFQNDDCEASLHLYRRLLAGADEKVDIIEIGFCQVLADLLKSEPDEYSPLCGVKLVRQKVGKLWIMGGDWSREPGKEFNFSYKPKARVAAHEVLELCPVEVVLLGFEVGEDVISGGILGALSPRDVLYQAMCDWGAEEGRSSWDPMTVYRAFIPIIGCSFHRWKFEYLQPVLHTISKSLVNFNRLIHHCFKVSNVVGHFLIDFLLGGAGKTLSLSLS